MKPAELNKYKAGDTITISTNSETLVSGTVYINGSIPMQKVYQKLYGINIVGFDGTDNYEDAIVIIDDNAPGILTVLTLEAGNMKLFRWNDVFESGMSGLSHKIIRDDEPLHVNYESALLTEIKHSFR